VSTVRFVIVAAEGTFVTHGEIRLGGVMPTGGADPDVVAVAWASTAETIRMHLVSSGRLNVDRRVVVFDARAET
jgi:hypothetical protein